MKTLHILFFLASTIVAAPLYAQNLSASAKPAVLSQIGIDQNLDAQLPLSATFRDESGNQVSLREYFSHGKPVILTFVYYDCPMLCNQILNGLVETLRVVSLDVSKDFDVLAVSFDPSETPALAAAKKESYLSQYKRKGAEQGWHFLTGDSVAIQQLTHAAGFRYTYDPATDQYAHASAIIIVTPQGMIARYFYGIEYPATDLRLSLIEASENKIGSPVDQVLLYCLHYDPRTGKYGLVIMNVLRLLGIATLVALGTFMVVMFHRDRRMAKSLEQRQV